MYIILVRWTWLFDKISLTLTSLSWIFKYVKFMWNLKSNLYFSDFKHEIKCSICAYSADTIINLFQLCFNIPIGIWTRKGIHTRWWIAEMEKGRFSCNGWCFKAKGNNMIIYILILYTIIVKVLHHCGKRRDMG